MVGREAETEENIGGPEAGVGDKKIDLVAETDIDLQAGHAAKESGYLIVLIVDVAN